jgi:hypothetical protein
MSHFGYMLAEDDQREPKEGESERKKRNKTERRSRIKQRKEN